ncbi:CocE/NonD family hydrolase [Spirillospora sp. CA-255316]
MTAPSTPEFPRTDPEHAVLVARKLMMTARDGVRLATDIYRPASADGEPLPGPFPAIVVRSPYNTRSGGPSSQSANGEFFASRGYLYVVQDCRGRYASGGDFTLLDNEGPDGYDTVEWVAALPYCDGNVGTQGTSLRAWNQNATALLRPPHLRCMWINQGGWNGARSALRHHGALELRWLTWAVVNGTNAPGLDAEGQAELVRQGERIYEWLRALPWTPGNSPLAVLPDYERWALDLYTHGDEDAFWDNPSRNFERYADESADVPTMYAGSWYDAYSAATVEKFKTLSARLAHQSLIMAPGIHGGPNFDRRMAGEVDMGEHAPLRGNLGRDRLHMMLRFYDRWLRGIDNGADEEPAVRYFVMGGGGGARNGSGRLVHGGSWRTAAAWPSHEPVPYFLHTGGLLSPEPPAGTDASSVLRYDPADPLPTIAGNVSSLHELLPWPDRGLAKPAPDTLKRSLVIQGAADQVTRPDMHQDPPYGRPLSDREDVLAFATAPLTAPVEVTGTVTARLLLSTDVPDTDLFVMLLDLYPASEEWPDGYRLNIADGLLRVRYRHGLDKPTLLEPGEIAEAVVTIAPTANLFDAGHRIGIWISSSSFPRFDPNPNTGEPIGRHTRTRVARTRVHHDARYPSSVSLPLAVR